MPRSGSKSAAARPRELVAWQTRAIEVVAKAELARDVVFGGGAALAAVHLHHRTSEDLDLSLATAAMRVDLEIVGPRTSLVLRRRAGAVGRIDFAYYPFDPIGRRTRWRGLAVESLLDMTVNKLQAVLTRQQPRDLVDLYFLLQEGPERDLDRLLDHVRAKFDVGAHRMGLAARLLLVHDVRELPRMIRPVTIEDLVAFFEARVHELARVG